MLMLITTMLQRFDALTRRQSSERGASLVEYALLVALIALVCFAAVTTLGGQVSSRYAAVGQSLA
jgi:Flp pilus assembly pilin Flp